MSEAEKEFKIKISSESDSTGINKTKDELKELHKQEAEELKKQKEKEKEAAKEVTEEKKKQLAEYREAQKETAEAIKETQKEEAEAAETVGDKGVEGFKKIGEEAGNLRGAHHIFEAITLAAQGGGDAISAMALGTRILGESFEALAGPIGPILLAISTLTFLASEYINKLDEKAEKAENSGEAEKRALDSVKAALENQVSQINAVMAAMDEKAKKAQDVNTLEVSLQKQSADRYDATLAYEAKLADAIEKRAESELELNRSQALKGAHADAEKQQINDQYDIDKAGLQGKDASAAINRKKQQEQAQADQAAARQAEIQKQIDEKQAQLDEFQAKKKEAISGAEEEGIKPSKDEKGETNYDAAAEAERQKIAGLERERGEEQKRIGQLQDYRNNPFTTHAQASVADYDIAVEQNKQDDTDTERREEYERQKKIAEAQAYSQKDKDNNYTDAQLAEIAKLNAEKQAEIAKQLEAKRNLGIDDIELETEANKLKAQQNEIEAKIVEERQKNAEAFAAELDKQKAAQPKPELQKGAKPPPPQKSEKDKLDDSLAGLSQAQKDEIVRRWIEDHASQAQTPEAKRSLDTAQAPYDRETPDQQNQRKIQYAEDAHDENQKKAQQSQNKADRDSQQSQAAQHEQDILEAQDKVNNIETQIKLSPDNAKYLKDTLDRAVSHLNELLHPEIGTALDTFAKGLELLVGRSNFQAAQIQQMIERVKDINSRVQASANTNS